MMILIVALIAGPVGDYLGYDYQFYIAYQGFDSLHSAISDTGCAIFDTITTIDTLTYGGHPAYLTHHVRASDLYGRNDTTLSWEIADTLFGCISIFDTILAKLYVTPFYIGSQWDLEITDETLIVDIDTDGIDDTLVVQNGEAEVIDYTGITVPLGTFDAFGVRMTMYLAGWQSIVNDSCHVRARNYQWLSPYDGIVRDSIAILDSVRFYGNWMEAGNIIMYSDAVDTGYVGIAEQPERTFSSILPILNGISFSGSGIYQIEIYDVLGRLRMSYDMAINGTKKLRPDLESGVYFARVKQGTQTDTTKFVVIR